MRHDLRLPFCAWLAHMAAASLASSPHTRGFDVLGVESMRRYEISEVSHAQPDFIPAAPQLQAAIDLVQAPSQGRRAKDVPDVTVADAELIVMVCEIVAEIGELSGCVVEVHLSHAALLLATLSYVGIASEKFDVFMRTVLDFKSGIPQGQSAGHPKQARRWSDFCKTMQNLNVRVGRIKPLLWQLPKYASEVSAWLRSGILLEACKLASPLSQALQQLDDLIQHLHTWGIGMSAEASCPSLVLDPFMPLPCPYHRGIIYQIVLRPPSSVATGATMQEVICSGGRYDALLKSIWPWQLRNEGIPAMRGAGVTIVASRLIALTSQLRKARLPGGPLERCLSISDVLVASRGGSGMLRERMQATQVKLLRPLFWPSPLASSAVGLHTAFTRQRHHHIVRRAKLTTTDPMHDCFEHASPLSIAMHAFRVLRGYVARKVRVESQALAGVSQGSASDCYTSCGLTCCVCAASLECRLCCRNNAAS
jgi:hypothetical protein